MAKGRIKPAPQLGGSRFGITSDPTRTPPDTEKCPSFSFRHLSDNDRFKFDACDTNEKCGIWDKLRILSQLTWQQIEHDKRHGNGTETLAKSAIRTSIPDCIDKAPVILAFHATGNVPIVGFRDEAVFYIVWLDPKRKLYKHS